MKVTLPASGGVKLAIITVSSPTNKFNESGLTVISVGTLLTVTVTVVVFSAYLPSPPTLTTIVAAPFFNAVTTPLLSTLTTPEPSGL